MHVKIVQNPPGSFATGSLPTSISRTTFSISGRSNISEKACESICEDAILVHTISDTLPHMFSTFYIKSDMLYTKWASFGCERGTIVSHGSGPNKSLHGLELSTITALAYTRVVIVRKSADFGIHRPCNPQATHSMCCKLDQKVTQTPDTCLPNGL